MKVFHPNQIQLQQEGTVKKKQGSGPSQSFAQALSNAQQEVSASNKTSAVSSVSEAFSNLSMSSLTEVQETAYAKGQEALTLLNHLAGVLENMDMSNTTLESLSGALGDRAKELQQVSQMLESSDPLREMLEQISVVSVVEQIKLTRGDYT